MSSEFKSIKLYQTTQVTKYLQKSDDDVLLLEQLRDYLKKRSDIETEYHKQLDRLAKSFSTTRRTKRSSRLDDFGAEDGQLVSTFNKLIAETEISAKWKTRQCEKTMESVEKLRDFAKEKQLLAKKHSEYAFKHQESFWNYYLDYERLKKTYDEALKLYESAKLKHLETGKRPKSALSTLSNIVRNTDNIKVLEKDALQRLNNARNDTVFAVEKVNSAQQHYDKEELPNLMKAMDGEFYERILSTFTEFADNEIQTSEKVILSMQSLKSNAEMITREKELELFLNENASAYEPKPAVTWDAISDGGLIVDHITRGTLTGRLKKDQIRVRDLHIVIEKSTEKLQEIGVIELDVRLQAAYEVIKMKNEVERLNAEISKLKESGLEENGPLPEMEEGFQVDVQPPVNLATASISNATVSVRALYDYQAVQDYELSFQAGDMIKLTQPENGLVGDWIEGTHKSTNKTGQFPVMYVEAVFDSPTPTTSPQETPQETGRVRAIYDYAAVCEGELSFTVGDIITVTNRKIGSDDWWEGTLHGITGQFPVAYVEGVE